jgi:hypothetical protein
MQFSYRYRSLRNKDYIKSPTVDEGSKHLYGVSRALKSSFLVSMSLETLKVSAKWGRGGGGGGSPLRRFHAVILCCLSLFKPETSVATISPAPSTSFAKLCLQSQCIKGDVILKRYYICSSSKIRQNQQDDEKVQMTRKHVRKFRVTCNSMTSLQDYTSSIQVL